MNVVTDAEFYTACDNLTKKDPVLATAFALYRYPPRWTRPCSFTTLLRIILEQQVSLASAKAAYDKVLAHTGTLNAANLLLLTDEELKACYFSRQKIKSARALALAVTSGELSFGSLPALPDDEVRMMLKKIHGIGDWSADVFLLFALQRGDIFPAGDIALRRSVAEVYGLPALPRVPEVLALAESWRPFRSAAAMLLWHFYLGSRNRQVV